jgi:hypothetical protein
MRQEEDLVRGRDSEWFCWCSLETLMMQVLSCKQKQFLWTNGHKAWMDSVMRSQARLSTKPTKRCREGLVILLLFSILSSQNSFSLFFFSLWCLFHSENSRLKPSFLSMIKIQRVCDQRTLNWGKNYLKHPLCQSLYFLWFWFFTWTKRDSFSAKQENSWDLRTGT